MQIYRLVFLLVAIPTLVPITVHAADKKSKGTDTDVIERNNRLLAEISNCRQIAPPLIRLKCFDAMGVVTDRKKAEEPVSDTNGKWKFATSTSPMNDTKMTSVTLPAEGAPDVAMTIRCNGDKPEVYIRWERRIASLNETAYHGGIVPIKIRLGKENAIDVRWGRSLDGFAAFVPEDAVKPFVKSIEKINSLAVQAKRWSDPNTITEVFDLTGLSSALKPLTEVCHLE